MDFDDAPEDAEFRAEWRAWLERHATRRSGGPGAFGAGVLESDRPDALERARAWQGQLAEAAWAAVHWPAEHGGRDATPTQTYIYAQEAAAFELPPDLFLVGLGMAGPTLIAWGTPEQQRRHLPPLIDGSELWCQLWSEPDAGSDIASLRTRARWDDARECWIVSGQKTWTTYAHFARWGYALVRTNPDVPKHAGLAAMIIDMQAPGVEIRRIPEMSGGATFNEVFLTDVEIPAEHLIGPVDHGWRVAMTTLGHERYTAGVNGLSGVSVEPLLTLARETRRDGRPLIDDPVIRQRLADICTRHKLLTLTIYRALTASARGREPGPEGSILKLAWSELASREAELALDMLGLRGTLTGDDAPDGGEWAAAYTFAPCFHLGGGTDEIQRTIIGERVLGLPREPRPDGAAARAS